MLYFIVGLSSLALLTAAQSCSDSGIGPAVAGLCPSGSTLIPSSSICCNNTKLVSTCVDLVNPTTGISDCPRLASYCNNSVYYTLMTQQCPKTCGRCSSTGTATTTTTTCVDLVNPQTGVSDCPNRVAYCNNAAYYTLMTQQCPRTCGRCSG